MEREAQFAAWWAAGAAVGHDLRAADGRAVRVLFPGRPGGPAGPDFRDAVVTIAGARLVGDVELHLHAAAWRGHGHSRDPRYNSVILHVVAQATTEVTATTLPSGGSAALVVLPLERRPPAPATAGDWPCQRQPPPAVLRQHLASWGAQRFEARVARFRGELAMRGATLAGLLGAAIAEALGYGRDPQATRQRWLTGDTRPMPDQLSTRRLAGLAQLLASPAAVDLAARCCGALLAGGERSGWERLVRVLAPGHDAIGAARGGIVAWNAVLPCLAAYGDRCGNRALARLARVVAIAAPGLPSNAIARAQSRWLGMTRLPPGALAQQGLHHLHVAWCRAKSCASCPLGE